MSFNHYLSELTALRWLGKQFAKRNPALAPFLGQSGRDSDMEQFQLNDLNLEHEHVTDSLEIFE